MMETTGFFWSKTLPRVNKVLANEGFAVMPTCNGVMCLIDSEDTELNCPPLITRFNCSQLASFETVLALAKLAIASL